MGTQAIKACHGLEKDQQRRYQEVLAAAAPTEQLVVIEDAAHGASLRNHSWVRNLPDIRFLAGAPIGNGEGSPRGMLYVMDSAPRQVSAAETDMLTKLADFAADEFQLRRKRGRSVRKTRSVEEALAAEQAFTKSALNALADLFFVFTVDGQFARWNDQVNAVTGYSDLEIASMHPVDFFASEDAPRIEQAVETVFDEGTTSVEAELVTKGGTRIPYEFTASLLTDDAGYVQGICGIGRDISRRKHAETARQESEHRWRALVENHPDPLVILKDEEVAYINPAGRAYFGVSPSEEVQGRSVTEILPAELMSTFRTRLEKVQQGKELEPLEYRFLTLDGEERFGEAMGVPVRYDGEPAMQSVVRDVTERKKTEEALRASQEQLTLALDAAAMGVWDWDVETGELVTSTRTRELFGFERDQSALHLDDFAERVHPEDRFSMEEAVEWAMSDGDLNVEYRVIHPDGTVRWMNTRGQVYFDKGEPTRMIGTVADVTARKETQQGLQESEARNRAMLHAIPDLIFRFSKEGVYLDVNAEQENQLVEPAEELLERSVEDVLPPDVAEQCQTAIREALRTRELQLLEYELVTQDGRRRTFEGRVVPLGDEEAQAIIRDITERKRYERHLEESRRRLKALFDNSLDAILLADDEGQYVEARHCLKKDSLDTGRFCLTDSIARDGSTTL